jgi:hypothetical protein
MLRKVLLFGLGALVSFSVRAQDKAELFGGYSYLHLNSSTSTNLNGWEISGQYKFRDWLGAVADVDGHYGSIASIGASTYTYLFGPQISRPADLSPFGHLLLGGAHLGVGGVGTTSFSMALGGGIDAKLLNQFYGRIQADYLMTQFGGGAQNNFRLSAGILIRF